MSKIAFFAFVTFLLTINVSSSQDVSKKIEDVVNRLKTVIDCYSKHFNDQINDIPSSAANSLFLIYQTRVNLSTSMYDIFFQKLRESENELHKGMKVDIFKDKTKCFNDLIQYEQNGYSTLEKTRLCWTKEINDSKKYVVEFQNNSIQLLNKFISFKDKAEECKICEECPEKDILTCVKDVSKKSQVYMMNEMNDQYKLIFYLSDKILEIFNSDTSSCSTESGLTEFFQKDIAEEIKKCVDCINSNHTTN